MITTQYDMLGQNTRRDIQIPAVEFKGYRWPDRPQFKDLGATIAFYNNQYQTGLRELTERSKSVPCIYDPYSAVFQPIWDVAKTLDYSYLIASGQSDHNSVESIINTVSERCRGEWWNVLNNRMSQIVGALFSNDEEAWGSRRADNWTRSVEILFLLYNAQYQKTCAITSNAPLDTIEMRTMATPDVVYVNKWGLRVITINGSPSRTYYYIVRKKFSKPYVDIFNDIGGPGIAYRMPTGELNIHGAAASYLEDLFNKIGCNSENLQLFEKQLFKAILFLKPMQKQQYLEAYNKYSR